MSGFQIFLWIIIIIAIILIFLVNLYNKIKTEMLKINSAESEIDISLRDKYDLLSKLIVEIEKNDKDEKQFKNFPKLKDENLSSFEFDRKLKDIENNVYNIKNNNSKLQSNNSFNDTWYEISNINTKISAGIRYYNENVTAYNLLVSKYPSKIIAIILHFNEKRYFDDKNMYDKNIKDFKI